MAALEPKILVLPYSVLWEGRCCTNERSDNLFPAPLTNARFAHQGFVRQQNHGASAQGMELDEENVENVSRTTELF
jgi:hypothetical protein